MIPLRKILLILFLAFQIFSSAQKDSVMLNPIFGVADAIYISYSDMRNGRAIHKGDINTKVDTVQLDFLSKVLAQDKFQFTKDGQTVTMECKKIWGFFQNNALYINYNNEFYRVPVFGSISYLVAMIKVVNPGFFDPRFGYQSSTTTTEMREFLMSFYDGTVQEFTMKRAENLMATDNVFYEQYKKLSTRQRKKQIYSLIRRFNDLHPVYILR